MDKHTFVHFCCNDGENGLFSGTAIAINIHETTFECLIKDGSKFSVVTHDKFKLGKKMFGYVSAKEWVGNWCWNGYLMPNQEAIKLIKHLNSSDKWQIEDGPEINVAG
jgi:hypothetical protein